MPQPQYFQFMRPKMFIGDKGTQAMFGSLPIFVYLLVCDSYTWFQCYYSVTEKFEYSFTWWTNYSSIFGYYKAPMGLNCKSTRKNIQASRGPTEHLKIKVRNDLHKSACWIGRCPTSAINNSIHIVLAINLKIHEINISFHALYSPIRMHSVTHY